MTRTHQLANGTTVQHLTVTGSAIQIGDRLVYNGTNPWQDTTAQVTGVRDCPNADARWIDYADGLNELVWDATVYDVERPVA